MDVANGQPTSRGRERMATEIRVEGISKFSAAIEKKIVESSIAAKTFVTVGGQIVTKNARRQFTTVLVDASGSRRIAGRYSRGKRGETIERSGSNISGAGGPPHIRSGYLARSIQTRGIKPTGRREGWMSKTGPTAIYGRRVELGLRGTDSKGRLYNDPNPFHPYLKPGLEMSRPELHELRLRLFGKAVNG